MLPDFKEGNIVCEACGGRQGSRSASSKEANARLRLCNFGHRGVRQARYDHVRFSDKWENHGGRGGYTPRGLRYVQDYGDVAHFRYPQHYEYPRFESMRLQSERANTDMEDLYSRPERDHARERER